MLSRPKAKASRPGNASLTSGDQNWSLRLPNGFEEHETIDLCAILKAAIIARGKDFATKHAVLIEKLG